MSVNDDEQSPVSLGEAVTALFVELGWMPRLSVSRVEAREGVGIDDLREYVANQNLPVHAAERTWVVVMRWLIPRLTKSPINLKITVSYVDGGSGAANDARLQIGELKAMQTYLEPLMATGYTNAIHQLFVGWISSL